MVVLCEEKKMSTKVVVPEANKNGVWVDTSKELPELKEFVRCIVERKEDYESDFEPVYYDEIVCELVIKSSQGYCIQTEWKEVETGETLNVRRVDKWWKKTGFESE